MCMYLICIGNAFEKYLLWKISWLSVHFYIENHLDMVWWHTLKKLFPPLLPPPQSRLGLPVTPVHSTCTFSWYLWSEKNYLVTYYRCCLLCFSPWDKFIEVRRVSTLFIAIFLTFNLVQGYSWINIQYIFLELTKCNFHGLCVHMFVCF